MTGFFLFVITPQVMHIIRTCAAAAAAAADEVDNDDDEV